MEPSATGGWFQGAAESDEGSSGVAAEGGLELLEKEAAHLAAGLALLSEVGIEAS